ncbi:MAG: hypothetical protein DDT20_00630 [Firmicutes bacterium]|nr:hypothetical protein [Bacillota bacterium]
MFAVVVGIGSGATLGLLEVIRILGGLRAIVSLLLRGGLAGALALFATDTALVYCDGPPFCRLLLAAVVTALTFFPLAWLLGLTKSLRR